jgi:hypothetical protein
VSNILNFIVLTRRSLRTEINKVLAAIAVTDGLVMLIYTPYAFNHAFDYISRDEQFSFGYALYIYFHATLTLTVHTISIFLTIVLAFYRYICVCRNVQQNMFMKQTSLSVIICCILAVVISIPLYFSMTINEKPGSNRTIYFVGSTEFSRVHETVYFFIYSVIIRILPCILLSFFSIKLIQVLLRAKKSALKSGITSNLFKKRRNQSDRTTALLVSVLILFLVTEFPPAILGLLSAILHRNFFLTCYQNLGEILKNRYKTIQYRNLQFQDT